jgi:hypothetical protein
VKQKTVITLMFVAFMLMWACTPLSLRRDNSKRAAEALGVLSKIEDAPLDSVAKVLPDAISAAAQAVPPVNSITQTLDTLKQTLDTLKQTFDIQQQTLDSLPQVVTPSQVAKADTLLREAANKLSPALDSLLENQKGGAAIKLKRDTTQMDSLELAIYKYNKVIDDSLRLDSLNRQKKNGIDSPVKYSARDSLTYEAGSGRAHLYGDSHVEYQNMDLKSEKIFMVLDSSLVHATGIRDTTTKRLTGTPVFKMGSDEYESDTMAFNFKTKKGLITQVYTKQEDGFLTSELSKRGANGEMFLQHGRYTTCDEPHPDFYLALSRAKVRPGKDVIFGPAYLVVCDVPLPLAIPYGFFPFTKSYSSGFIMPTYGDETDRGFYLRDGGYYFAISDKMDLKLIGEIFTKGSWGFTATSNYNRRYKYTGSFLVTYQNSVSGEKNMPDYSKTTSFKVIWNHRQDSKANPYSSLSASVNFATSSFEQNNLSSMYNPQTLTQSTRTSSVNYNTGFSSLGMNISSSFELNQNMRDSSIAMTLPRLNVSVSKFFPFKRKKMVGKERWYEKINVAYTGDFSNSINTKEDKLMHSDFRRDWQNSIRHTIPVNANFMMFDVVNLNPSFNLSAQNSFLKTHKEWDVATQKELTDTITGFYTIYNWSLNLTASTKLYGMFVPSRKLFGDKIQAIRHVLTPSVTFSYAPDFGSSRYGYYSTYEKTDKNGNVSEVEYSPYRVGSVSVPGHGKTGSIRFSIKNNVEMKYRDKNDSVRKVSLIDELGADMSYNMAATRQPWSSLNTNLRLKLTKSYTFAINAVFKSYVYEADSVGATPRESDHTTYWGQGKIGRFQGMSQTLNYTLDNTKVANFFKWLRGEKVDKKKDDKKRDDEEDEDDYRLEANVDKEMEKAKHGAKKENAGKAETDEDGYMTFSVPWSVQFGYGITMSEDTDVKKFNYSTMRYPYKFTQTLNFSGNVRISDGWNITFSSGYDFENKKISMTTASLSRDLHCFNMSCSVVLAPYTSYNFSFRCNASTLTDALKYDKRSGNTNQVQWY